MLKIIFILTYILTPFLSFADDQFLAEAKEILFKYKKELKKTLLSEIKKGGVHSAVKACHIQSPKIPSALSQKGFKLGRTSFNIRNEENRPQEWMKPLLHQYETSTLKKPLPGKLIQNEKFQAYVEPLYIGGICLSCHGDSISFEIQKKIKLLYPKDQALGYKTGQFRGLFWIMKSHSIKR